MSLALMGVGLLVFGGAGCGSGVDGEVTTGTTLVITTLERPAATSVNLAVKGASTKALNTTDTVVGEGIACRLTKLDGTVLGTATSDAAGKCTFAVDGNQIANQTLVVTSDELGAAKCEAIGSCPGAVVDLGVTDPDSTVEAGLFLDTCGGNLEDMTGAVASVAAGTCVPKGVIETIRQLIAAGGTAGTSTAEGAVAAIREAFRAALVEQKFVSGNAFRDLRLVAAGDGSVTSQWSALGGVAMDQAMAQAKGGAAALNELYRDSAAFAIFKKSGSAAWAAMASYVGNLDTTGNKRVQANPAVPLNILTEVAGETGADAAAFLKKRGGALALTEAVDEEDCKSSDAKALYKLLKSASWETIGTGNIETHVQALCNTIVKAKDDPAQLAYLKDRPEEVAQAIFAKPEAFAHGTESVIKNILNVGVAGGVLGSKTLPCTSNSDCGSGEVCGPQDLCTATSGSGTDRALNTACTENSQCRSGLCKFDPAIGYEFCAKAKGEAQVAFKGFGKSCKGNLECQSYLCTAGQCATAAPPPEAALALLPDEAVCTAGDTGGTGSGDGRAATTTDTTAPTVVVTGQTDGAKGVSVTAAITITFSEEMDSATITTESVRVTSDQGVVAGTVTYKDRTVTFTPNNPLAYFTSYTVTLSTAIKDAAGNALASTVTSSFRTETAPPKVIVGGGGHTVVVVSDGTVWTWGYNSNGQLGDGATTDRATPARVSGLTTVRTVAAGNLFSLAVKEDGTAWAWGANTASQLGDGTTTDRTTPVQVAGLTDVTAAAGGLNHGLALLSDGTIRAWGSNGNGRLGDGTTTNRATPVAVSNLTNVTAIEAGGSHSLALRSDGTVWAWGFNAMGQLGDNSVTQKTTPVQVNTITNITAIAGGLNYSIALRNDGTVWAWGTNTTGQLGDGTATQRTTPVQVSGLTGITTIAAGDNFNLAYRNDGTVWAWGYNASGQLADGTRTTRTTPVQSTGLANLRAIAAGGSYGLAVTSDRALVAWGYNFYGQLGDGSATYAAYAPNPVRGLSGITAIATSGKHSIVRKSDGTAWTWGVNQNGQLGDGSKTDRGLPAQVTTLANVVGVAAGGKFSVAVKGDGTVSVWGINSSQELGIGAASADVTAPTAVGGNLSGITAVAAGDFTAYGIKNDRTLWAWGSNSNGQLGNGALTNPGLPAQVNILTNVTAVAGGGRHAVALLNDGTVWAWGLNGNGQLGDNSTTQRTAPVQVNGLTNMIGIAAGSRFSLAVKNDGTVWAWGQNSSGQLGDGTTTQRTTPVQVSGLTGASAVAAGPSYSLAVKNDGTVWAWGSNSLGQLGDGTAISTGKETPIATNRLTTATRISAGGSSTLSLARSDDGRVWEWGWTQSTALTDGTSPYVLTPVSVRWP